ncbi:MAG: DUF1330 domain-containing protein [Alphaproteobacteria bacterium]
MVAYAIVLVEVTDPDKFQQYAAQVPEILKKYGGRYLARGGRLEVLNGEWPSKRLVVLEFPSIEAAKRWHDSPEYAGPRKLRDASARVNIAVVEGLA